MRRLNPSRGMARLLFFMGVAVMVFRGVAGAVEYIDINNPFIRKIPIAVPFFQAKTGTEVQAEIAEKGAVRLAETLEFTGFFKILDRAGFLEDPQRMGIETPQIRFDSWTTVGAELLVTGGFEVLDGALAIELRLYDTFKGRLLVGKRYQGARTDLKKIIRRFCDDIIYTLTGQHGIFTSRIAFVSNGTGNKEIYTCDFDGSDPKQLTRTKAITISPAWSLDGDWIAYTSYLKGKPDLFIKNLKDGRSHQVTHEGLNITPAWRPFRQELAATLSFTGDQEIYLLTETGKTVKRLTHNQGIDVSPSWSPDGKKFAFVSKRAGTPQIYIQDVESNVVQRVTYYGRHNTQPAWSPAGDRIAYTSLEGGETNIFIVGIDGKEPVQLTRNAGDNESPAWSPDGNLIAFCSYREGPARIYVMTAFGTDQRRLLTLSGEQTDPAWSPRSQRD
ncbi:MAG: Tol-Pal system beta propeller repeat protein TolB [Deltaproteobacteria bacterium]|nr:Tol-Pal system beta propeller repeat protein TolB [Deltaproteobacteria bacterium]MBW2042450.1 Tol-Pal system beta propeller repeat protein TolB [Deltaproteobacteria bacterium]MBW2132707.1 Tol-Pal system beta propeller repeat protein TolB [Deltaproteobacteria bacterium]